MSRRSVIAAPGDGLAFVAAAIGSTTDECIIWPYGCTTSPNGYRTSNVYDGERNRIATHLVLEGVGRTRPSAKHECCHDVSCPNDLCINPRHVRWDTHAANMADLAMSGTNKGRDLRGTQHPSARLTESDVLAIRRRYQRGFGTPRGDKPGNKHELAAEYGVCPDTIVSVAMRRSWAHVEG